MAYCDRTKDNGFKHDRFRLGTRIKLFVMLVVKHCNRFPREVVDVQSLEIFNQGPVVQASVPPEIVEDVVVYCTAYYMTCKCSFHTELILRYYDSMILYICYFINYMFSIF